VSSKDVPLSLSARSGVQESGGVLVVSWPSIACYREAIGA